MTIATRGQGIAVDPPPDNQNNVQVSIKLMKKLPIEIFVQFILPCETNMFHRVNISITGYNRS